MFPLSLELPIRLSVVEAEGVSATGRGTAYDGLVACAGRYHGAFAARGVTAPGDVPGVEVARQLFHALSIDPTRHRPCSEALLNRALKEKPQPRVNDLVDVGNWCALDFLLPLGIYDADAVDGAVVLRRGRDGETYLAINGREINLAGRYVLADETGPFGSPITDSQRTAITPGTTRTLVIMYAPESYEGSRLRDETERLADRLVAHCGGSITRREVVGRS